MVFPQVENVDTTSTSMTKHVSLEKEISKRPAPEELQRRGILKEGGTLAAQRSALERELAKDSVSRQIDSRPDYAHLVDSNIALAQGVAPLLQAAARQLDRNLKANQLNQHLYNRVEPEELDKAMPASNVAPRLRSARIALEQAFTRDHLNHLLQERPNREALVQRNILKSTAAPQLQAAQARLQRQMVADRISNLLESRENTSELERENILQDSRVAPTLQSAQKDLQRNLAKSNLYHALQSRPTVEKMIERGLLPEYEDVSVSGGSASHSSTQAGGPLKASHDSSTPYQRRSRNFVLTRLLLKFVANLGEAGEISMQQKGYLKDLIVDQDPAILAAAEVFEADGQIDEFKDTLLRFSLRT